MNMSKVFVSLMVFVCLLFTACDKDSIVRPPIDLTWDILTPENVKYAGGSAGWAPQVCFKAIGQEGDVVLTCRNYNTLGFADTSKDVYDCGWVTLRIEDNKVIIHFPKYVSDMPEESEDITIIGRDGKLKAHAVIGLTRIFDAGNQTASETVP